MMKLVFLGTGGSYPTPQRNVSSLAVKHQSDVYLFDCGEGTQRQFMRSSLSFMETKKIFVTHFHGDHFLGLPGLIQSMNLNDRDDPLEIYGPRGTVEFTEKLIQTGYFNPAFEVQVNELNPGAHLGFDGFSISTISSEHNVPSLAYKFKQKDKSGRFDKQKALSLGVPEGPLFSLIQNGETVEVDGKEITPDQILGPPRKGKEMVYTGDTRPSDEIRGFSKNADALIHEGTLGGEMSDRAVERGHSSIKHAAKAAKRAGVQKLFIVHLSPRYNSADALEEEARDIFENTTIPRDLYEYEF